MELWPIQGVVVSSVTLLRANTMRIIALVVATLAATSAAHAQATPPFGAAPNGGRATSAGYLEVQNPNEFLVTDLIGRTVFNYADENLGVINDIVYFYDGRATALVLGIGGFLGIGVKNVAITYGAFMLLFEGADIRLLVDATGETLAGAPPFHTLDELDIDPRVPANPGL